MLEQVIYENHLGETVVFGAEGIYINESDLRDYSWSYDTDNSRISNFRRSTAATKTLPVIIKKDTETEALEVKNGLYEIVEKDILSGKYGRLIMGDYYYKCYLVSSAKSKYLISKQYLLLTLKVVTDVDCWIKEITYSYYGDTLASNVVGVAVAGFAKVAEIDLAGYKTYNYDYDLDYAKNDRQLTRLENPHVKSCDFRMVINGPIDTPAITIGGHTYSLNYKVLANQQVTINSKNKTIVLSASGITDQNIFNYRDKSSYIFEPIPVGLNEITWNGDYEFTVTLLIDRSEPLWT